MRSLPLTRKIRNAIIRAASLYRPLESTFTYIHANNRWGHRESVSGHGSSMEKTSNIRREIPGLLKTLRISSLFDVPCGDLNWICAIDLQDIAYTGGDIVRKLISANSKRFDKEEKSFVHIDVTAQTPPRVDLILCRDLLVHLPLEECRKTIAHFIESGSIYLLTTTYTSASCNTDITAGAWRPINLQLPPFEFPAPIMLMDDGDADPSLQDYGKHLGLWRLHDVLQARVASATSNRHPIE